MGKTKTFGRVARLVFAAIAALLCAFAFFFMSPSQAWAGGNEVKIGTVEYATLQDAIDNAVDGDTIELIADVLLDTACAQDVRYCLGIKNKSITIDGGAQYSISSDHTRGIYIYGGDTASDRKTVKFKDVVINKSGDQAIATRGGYVDLILDGVTANAGGSGNNQLVCVGGTHAFKNNLTITNSTLTANPNGYAVVTYNPANIIVEGSSLTGYAAMFFKSPDSSAGSAGTAVTVSRSTLSNNGLQSGSSDDFGTVVFADSDISFDVSDSDIVVKSSSGAAQSAFNIRQDSSVSVKAGTSITMEGENSIFCDDQSATFDLVVNEGTISNKPIDAKYLAVDALQYSATVGEYTIEPAVDVLAKANASVDRDGKVVYYPSKAAAEADSPGQALPDSYKVTFTGDGITDSFVFANENETITAPAAPTREGYDFKGWFNGGTEWVFGANGTKVTEPVTLTAKWDAQSRTVTFDDCIKSTSNKVETVSYGDKVSKPADPVLDGWKFEGWFSDTALTQEYDFNAAVTSNIILYAKWSEVDPTAPPATDPVAPGTEGPASADGTGLAKTGDSTWMLLAGLGIVALIASGSLVFAYRKLR